MDSSSKTRLTRQGIRDLNYYGPRSEEPVKAEPAPEGAAEAPPAPIEEDVATTGSDAP